MSNSIAGTGSGGKSVPVKITVEHLDEQPIPVNQDEKEIENFYEADLLKEKQKTLYWQKRCEAAEKVLDAISGKDIVYPMEYIEEWQQLKSSPSPTPVQDWIKCGDDLPPECTVVLGYSPKWIDEDFEPEGIRECFYNDGDWCSAKWDNDQDCWFADYDTKPTHWMQRPKNPNNHTPSTTAQEGLREEIKTDNFHEDGINRCVDCGCRIEIGERYCAECLCEDDSNY